MADVIMPQMGESIAEGTVTKWLKSVGDRVERDEPLFEISTDKVDAEIPSPAAGVLQEIRVAPGTTVPVNTVVAVIAAEGEAVATAPAPQPAAVPPVVYQIEGEAPPTRPLLPQAPPDLRPREEMSTEDLRLSRSSPVVRRIAAEHHLDIAAIPGTGIGGRVTKQDILGHLESHTETATHAAQADGTPVTAAAAPAVPSVRGGRVEVVPMSPIRKKTAEHMVLSKRTSAHVSTVFEVDLTRVDQLREKHRQAFEARGAKLTYLPFVVKAVVEALKAFPVLNASIEGDSIVYHRELNLGIAVALDWGLIVPVVHHADEKNVLGLARAVSDLAERARAKRLKVEEVQGGTFTITNPGVFGSLFGTPIINQPQVAILGIGTIEKRPVVRDDAIAIRTMSYFALTFDHRLVDGADADRFMAHLKRTLQEFDEAAL
ncbi:MAG TPA: dihydrolipoamide acetyltransferase family protein [Vicinamibacteria bacterium]|nr:dihydrolipoamide acetyltransferase family protein [Vicinamibacteria bacterium]